MSQTPPEQPSAPDDRAQAPTIVSPKFSTWPARLLLLATVGIVFGPVIYHEAGPAEIAKWHLAAAREHQAQQRTQAALDSYQEAIRWHPTLWLIYQERAAFHTARQDYQLAIEDWDRSLQHFPLAQRSEIGRRFAISMRGNVLMHLKRFDEVIAEAKELVEELSGEQPERRQRRIFALNWLAYARALADQDVDAALQEIDESIRIFREEAPSGWPNASLLDTRGFVLYRLGKHKDAKQDLDEAIKALVSEQPPSGGIETATETMAIIYYHRGLVNEALGDKTAANVDYQKVRDLGFTPSPDLF